MGTAFKMTANQAVKHIRLWASKAPPEAKNPDPWLPVKRIRKAALKLVEEDARELRTMLLANRRRFKPLEDPFEVDFATHRWLEESREESYSDWLEWVLRQIPTPNQLWRLFFPEHSIDYSGWPEPVIRREVPTPHGHENRQGRLDLAVRYHRRALLVIEVKLGHIEAKSPEAMKHSGYRQWMSKQHEPKRKAVILLRDRNQNLVKGFRSVDWRDLCLRLRKIVPEIMKRRGTVSAGMVLAFVGAVEQNLLGLPSQPLESVRRELMVNVQAVVRYLNEEPAVYEAIDARQNKIS